MSARRKNDGNSRDRPRIICWNSRNFDISGALRDKALLRDFVQRSGKTSAFVPGMRGLILRTDRDHRTFVAAFQVVQGPTEIATSPAMRENLRLQGKYMKREQPAHGVVLRLVPIRRMLGHVEPADHVKAEGRTHFAITRDRLNAILAHYEKASKPLPPHPGNIRRSR